MFKKFTLILSFVLCNFALSAQFLKGDKLIGGGVFFLHSSSENLDANGISNPISQTDLQLFPYLGFFITNNVALGGSVGYTLHKYSQRFNLSFSSGQSGTEVMEQTVSIRPFIKIYWKLADIAGFHLTVSSGVGIGKQESKDINSSLLLESDVFETGIELNPSFYYFITPRIGLEASFGGFSYEYHQLNGSYDSGLETESNTTLFRSTFGNSFQIGFNYYFGNSIPKVRQKKDPKS